MKKWVSLFVAVLIALVLLFPYLVGFPPFKQMFFGLVKWKTGVVIEEGSPHLSWFGPQHFEHMRFHTDQLEGTADRIDIDTPFWAMSAKKMSMEGGSVQIHAPDLPVASLEQINIRIEGHQISGSGTTREGGRSGKFSVDGTVISRENFDLSFSAAQMPTAAIDQIFQAQGMLVGAIGPSFDASGSASLQAQNGNGTLHLTSSSSKIELAALLTPSSVTLRGPLLVSLKLTPQLTRMVTKGALSITSIDPAILRIAEEGFVFPLPFSLEKLEVRQGSLNLGRIHIDQANFLAPFADLLDLKKPNAMDLWLTDADFSLQDGLLELGRVDALLERSFHVCAWGNVNFVQDQLDMIFGIPADTLASKFKVKGAPRDYVLQIPVHGTLEHPEFDKSGVTAKVAALVAASAAQRQGGVIGIAAGIFAKAFAEKSPPPKRPFPWEKK